MPVADGGIVAEQLQKPDEQLSDLGRRFSYEDAHVASIGTPGTNRGWKRYENGMNGAHVLVVDDEADIRGLLRELLERAGHRVSEAADGREGLRALYAAPPELVILDVSMPGLDGFATLERIRDLSDVPVLMLTARGQELEKVRGLKAGADDYVVKPFGKQELLARVQALLRRSAGAARPAERYDDGVVAIDFAASEATVDGEPVALTPLELRVLAALVRHPGQVLSHEQLLELAWRDDGVSRDQVKLYVGYLRRKLGARAGLVATVRGFGYRYLRPKG